MHIRPKDLCDNCKKELTSKIWTKLELSENWHTTYYDFCNMVCLKEWVNREKDTDTATS